MSILAKQWVIPITDLIARGQFTYNPKTGEANMIIKGNAVNVVDGGWFTALVMPDHSAIFIDRRKPRVNREKG